MTFATILAETRREARATYREIATGAGGRDFTADERATLRAVFDEARAVKADIIRARGGNPWLDELAALDDRPRGLGSPGAQFVASDGFAFFRRGEHRRPGAWRSPVVEVIAPPSLHATTITEAGLTVGEVAPMRPVPGLPTLASLLRQGRTTANAVQVPIETAPPALIGGPATAENTAKPALTMGAWSLWTVPVNKVAGTVPISEELFEDVPGVAAYIDSRLMRAADLAVDADIVTQLSTLPGRTPDLAAAALTNALALLAQACHVYTNSGYIPDFIALHPLALWATLAPPGEVLTGATLFPKGTGAVDLTSAYLYGMRMLPTPAVPTPTTALVGDADDAVQIFWRDDFAIEVTNSHLDNFTHDLLMLRGERRYALVPYLQRRVRPRDRVDGCRMTNPPDSSCVEDAVVGVLLADPALAALAPDGVWWDKAGEAVGGETPKRYVVVAFQTHADRARVRRARLRTICSSLRRSC